MKVYVLEFDMFDGEDEFRFIEVYKNKTDAQKQLEELTKEYEEFWEDFNIIDKDENQFCAFNEGFYDDAHIEIIIEEKEII